MNKESILKNLNEIKELVNDDKKFKYKNIVNFNCEYIKKELEAIKNTDVIDNYTSLKNDNANFNEALECLECLNCEPEDYRSNDRAKDYDTIKNYILKSQEEHRSLEILNKNRIDIESFYTTFIDNSYNYKFYEISYGTYGKYKLTEEEFNLLKGILNDEQ